MNGAELVTKTARLLAHLTLTLNMRRGSGGVFLERSSIKIDSKGYIDKNTGERYQRVVAEDITVSDDNVYIVVRLSLNLCLVFMYHSMEKF